MICPGCGASYDSEFKFCPQCARASQEPEEPRSALCCSRCQQADAVQKVSGVVQSGSSETQATVRDAFGHTRTVVGQSSTSLATMLAPPKLRYAPPNSKEQTKTILMVLLGVPLLLICVVEFCALPFLGIDSDPNGSQPLTAVWMAVSFVTAAGAVALWVVALKHSNHIREKHGLPAFAKWDQLYYCSRCNGVFVPGHARFIPTGQVRHYLYE